jgi:hypothetical protein
VASTIACVVRRWRSVGSYDDRVPLGFGAHAGLEAFRGGQVDVDSKDALELAFQRLKGEQAGAAGMSTRRSMSLSGVSSPRATLPKTRRFAAPAFCTARSSGPALSEAAGECAVR